MAAREVSAGGSTWNSRRSRRTQHQLRRPRRACHEWLARRCGAEGTRGGGEGLNPDACGVCALDTEVSEGGFGLRVNLGEVILRRRPGGHVHGLAGEWVTRDRGKSEGRGPRGISQVSGTVSSWETMARRQGEKSVISL